MRKILHKLLSENKSTFIHDILFNTLRDLERQFPKSRLTIIISPVNYRPKATQNKRIFFGPLDEKGGEKPVYYASAIKPAIVSVVVAEAVRQNIDQNDSVVHLTLNAQVAWELYSDLLGTNNCLGSDKRGYPYLSRIILPRIDIDQLTPLLQFLHKSKDVVDDKALEKAIRSIQDPRTRNIAEALSLEHEEHITKAAHKRELKENIRERKKQFYKDIKDKTDDLGKVSLGELIRSTLGPSSNVAISVLVKYLGELIRDTGITPQDFIQARMDKLLGSESLLTINNSSKEQKTGLWNSGRLSELMIVFAMIMNNDPRLGLSNEYLTLMKGVMEEEFADPIIELKQRTKRMGLLSKTQFVGKSGYFSDLDILPEKSNSMNALMGSNGWNSNQITKATYIVDMERLMTENGKIMDMAVAVGIPHNETDNTILQKQKVLASGIVMDKLLSLLELLLS